MEKWRKKKQEVQEYDAFRLLRDLLVEAIAVCDYCAAVSALPNCNSCTNRECGYLPKEGEDLRINCPLWKGEDNDD